ncbi:MAG: leucine-rich repeat protein [Eubacteriaceae bacterium]|jgi:hypothetical protein|nr:leucine-rich repeat protein [Eubacteriaceae bacterium]
MTNAISRRILAFALAIAVVIAFTPAIAFTQSASAATRPGKVKWSSITKTPTTITLKWKKASKAKGYSVYQKKSGKYKKIKTTTKRTYTVKKLKAFTSYSFKVRAYRMSGGKKVYGKYSSVKKVTTAASKITGVTITSSASSVSAGSNVTFTATVTGGTKPLKYQWYKDGVLIEGATESTYTAALSSSDSGSKFTCKVTGPDGKSLTSEEAGSVTVYNPAVKPSSVTVADQSAATGSTATFTATVTGGTAPLTYQWYQKTIENTDFTKISGATSSTYSPQIGTTGKVTMHNNNTQYKCVVSNSAGSVDGAGTLTVTGATVTNSWNIGNKTVSSVNYNGSNGADNVVATLYSDGELAVIGKGDTVLFGDKTPTSGSGTSYQTPWRLEGKTSAITSSTIASDVTPANMGYWYIGCNNLTSAPAIPSSVESMADTFYGCTSLTAAPTIPSSVTEMVSTFEGCAKLTTAPTIPSSVTDMGSTFEGCSALTTAPTIPSSVTNMGSTFSGCRALTTAPTIPSSVENLYGTFQGCSSLKSAPDLSGCTKLTNMYQTFSGCIALTTAPTIPDSVEDMLYTFSGCSALTAAPTIPSSVTVMNYTFNGCSALTGTMLIKADPHTPLEFGGCFSGAATNSAGLTVNYTSTSERFVNTIISTWGPLGSETQGHITKAFTSVTIADQTASSGGTATFTAAVAAGVTPAYQWQKSTDGGKTFADISGAIAATLSLTGLTTSDNGNVYRCVVSNGTSTAYGEGTLTVN